jgi:hypothetical protein
MRLRLPILLPLLLIAVIAGCEAADESAEAASDSAGDTSASAAAIDAMLDSVGDPRPAPVDTSAPAQPPARHLTPGEVAWAEMRSWSGTGDKATERFQVNSDEWRLVGAVEPLAGAEKSWVIVKVYDAQRNHVYTFSIEEPGADTSYVHGEPGLYFLTVGTQEARWRLSAQERRLPAEVVRPGR